MIADRQPAFLLVTYLFSTSKGVTVPTTWNINQTKGSMVLKINMS
jgi:hypothetical protein